MTPDIEWRAAAGGQIDSDSHGAVDIGVRAGPWSAELLTDTLLLRYGPEFPDGRMWLAVRGEAAAAGLFITPWTDGAPDPSRALFASYAGAEWGAVRYLGPLYAGVSSSTRLYVFGAQEDTTIPVPGPRLVGELQVQAGYWRPTLHLWGQAGVRTADGISPAASLEGAWRPDWIVRPRIEVRAGLADNADDTLRTRLGGLTPYAVPVAGAAWAEWWVEDYAAARVGAELHLHPGKWTVDLGPMADIATFDGAHAEGFGAGARVTRGRWFGEVVGGYAPWITRGPGVSRASVWFAFGADWG